MAPTIIEDAFKTSGADKTAFSLFANGFRCGVKYTLDGVKFTRTTVELAVELLERWNKLTVGAVKKDKNLLDETKLFLSNYHCGNTVE